MSKAKIDCVILRLDEPEEWFQRCYDSLEHPDIRRIVMPGLPGQIGLARKQGFFATTAPLVMQADPDDIYFPDVILEMAETISQSTFYSHASSGEYVQHPDGRIDYHFKDFHPTYLRTSPTAAHGVLLFKRFCIHSFDGLEHFRHKNELWYCLLRLHFLGHKIYQLNRPGRIWRHHSEQASQKPSGYDEALIFDFLEERLAKERWYDAI